MDKFVALLASGIAYGAITSLVAIGFIVLYNGTRVINFAHGDLVTLGAYFAYWGIAKLGMSDIPAYLFALVLMLGAGIVLERVAYAPLRRRSTLVVLISTLGAGIIIRAVIAIWFGSNPVRLDSPVAGETVTIAGAHIATQRIVIIVVTAIVLAVVFYTFQRTSFGRQLRALADDRETAMLMGIRVRFMGILIFAISAFLAGLAGILAAPLVALDTSFGFGILLTAFAAAILGGFGSISGVVMAAMFLGLVQQLVGGYLVPNYSDTLAFGVMLLALALRPQGIFARGVSERL